MFKKSETPALLPLITIPTNLTYAKKNHIKKHTGMSSAMHFSFYKTVSFLCGNFWKKSYKTSNGLGGHAWDLWLLPWYILKCVNEKVVSGGQYMTRHGTEKFKSFTFHK